jgi:hypothetical protein
MSELDAYGALAGTDKSSSVAWCWDYLRHYEELFRPFRDQKINLLEIGVASGASLAVWTRYFSQAQIVGVEINPDGARFAGERVAIRIGSQEDPGFLHSVVVEFPPTIIIDDGSHLAHHMIASFEALFPTLLPGGVYIFEDMAFHFEESDRRFQGAKAHQGHSDKPIYDYLNNFMRARVASARLPAESWGFARYAFEHIDSVTLAGGFIAVRKKAPRDVTQPIAVFERELAQGGGAEAAARYAEYLIKHNVHLDRAAALVPNILAAGPRDEAIMISMLNILITLERFDEAAEIATHLTRIGPANARYWDQLVMIERRRHRPEAEAAALRRLIALQPKLAGHHLRLSELAEHTGDLAAAVTFARGASELEPGHADFRNRVAALEGRLAGR